MFACFSVLPCSKGTCPQEKLLALASSFSPLVEDTARGVVIFSLVGLGRLIGPLDQVVQVIARTANDAGIRGNLAVSADPDTAHLLAANVTGLTMVAPGKEAARLGELPIPVLVLSPFSMTLELLDTLERWGIRTLGELAELPELGFVARFGEEGTRILRLARGETRRVLRAVQPPEDFERRQDLEHPQRLMEPLLFILSALLHELTQALERQGLATNRVHLGLSLFKRPVHQRTLEFPVPVRDAKVILQQLQMDLEAHPPQAAIVGLRVRLDPVEPRTLQHGLFIPKAPAPEKLQMTVTRLKALLGEGNVGSPELLNSHRPDAYVMRAFLPESLPSARPSDSPLRQEPGRHIETVRFAFRYWRPAAAAQVRLRAERPVQVDAGAVRMRAVKGEVLAVAGPWRASGDWWEQSAWEREEWDVELSNGGVYRLFHTFDHDRRQWFVEGMYD